MCFFLCLFSNRKGFFLFALPEKKKGNEPRIQEAYVGLLRGPGKEWEEEGWKEAFNWGGTSQKGREKKKLLLQLLPLLDYLAHAHTRAGRRS